MAKILILVGSIVYSSTSIKAYAGFSSIPVVPDGPI
jgi:hypothetical protein